MGEMERAITGEYPLCENAGCARAFRDIERRVEVLEKDETKEKLWSVLREIQQDLANLKGRQAGYLFAGGFLGAVVGALAAVVAALVIK